VLAIEDFYEPNAIAAIDRRLRRTAWTFENSYHHMRRSQLLSIIHPIQVFNTPPLRGGFQTTITSFYKHVAPTEHF
jgi:hypothetical protein